MTRTFPVLLHPGEDGFVLAECPALERIGYRAVRSRGSHVWLEAPGRAPVPVPLHQTLDRGTLRMIIRTSALTVEERLGDASRALAVLLDKGAARGIHAVTRSDASYPKKLE